MTRVIFCIRKALAPAIVFAAALAGPLHAPALAAGDSRALKPITLQLNWKHQFQFAGYYIAIEKGFYRKEGFDVRVVEVQDGRDPVDEVLKGNAEFGVGASELALRKGRGDPLVVLAVILQHSPLVLIARGPPVQSLQELAGKRLMLIPHETELYAYLQREGVPRSRFIEVPHSFDTAELIDGKVDALSGYSTDEPFVLRQKKVPFSIFSPRASGIDFYGDSLFTTERMLRADPRAVAAFRRASLAGWHYALANPGEAADLIRAKYSTRHSREHLLYEAAEMERLMQPRLIEIGHTNPGRWRHIAEVYAELGMLPEAPALDGFIYDPHPAPDLSWLHRGLWAAVLAALLVGFYAARTLRFNRILRREIDRRVEIERDLREVNERLEGQVREVRSLQTRLEEQALRDSLTGLHNRRYLDDMLERELPRAQRYGYPVSIVLADLDHFKVLNDTYGHQAGDAFLRAVAAKLNEGVRAGDMVCRWGGEEFALVLPNMSLRDAQQRAETWLSKVRDMRVRFGEFELKLTMSAGIAAYPGNGRAPAELLKAADDALYQAKRDGRDCIRTAGDTAPLARAAPTA
jgi:diguanylate cyclase (GGDEF)-like protein